MKKILSILLLSASLATADENERALVDQTTGDVISYRQTKEAAQPNPVRWVTVTRDPAPAYDPATQRIERVVTVAPDKKSVAITWNIIALTQAELDAIAAAAAVSADNLARRNQLRNVILTLEAGTATSAQVQTAVAKLIRAVFGDVVE